MLLPVMTSDWFSSLLTARWLVSLSAVFCVFLSPLLLMHFSSVSLEGSGNEVVHVVLTFSPTFMFNMHEVVL